MGTTAVDETDHLTLDFKDQKALRVQGDACGDLFQGGGFVTFIGADFYVVTAGGVCGDGVAKVQGGQ